MSRRGTGVERWVGLGEVELAGLEGMLAMEGRRQAGRGGSPAGGKGGGIGPLKR